MARILAIEGDSGTRARIEGLLERRGYRVIVAATGDEGIKLARAKRPGLVLLEQTLPDRNGLEVCKALKANPVTDRIPVVMMMDRPDAIERAVLHELGAAEHLVKPFTPVQLLARVEAAIAEPSGDDSRESQRIGRLVVRSGGPIELDGEPLDLTPAEVALLLVLCDGGERVYTRAELRERVWGKEGTDETRLVDQYVKRLRKKLGRAGAYVETVHGVGYRFAKSRAEREGEG